MAFIQDKRGGWRETKSSAANTALQIVTDDPGDGSRPRLSKMTLSVSGAASGTDILVTVKDGSTIIWTEYVNAVRGQALNLDFIPPLMGTDSTALTFDVAAAGVAAITHLNVHGDFKG